MMVRPAAGPLTCTIDPPTSPATMPPMTAAMIPAIRGAPEATAIPRDRGTATRKTTREAPTSAATPLRSVWVPGSGEEAAASGCSGGAPWASLRMVAPFGLDQAGVCVGARGQRCPGRGAAGRVTTAEPRRVLCQSPIVVNMSDPVLRTVVVSVTIFPASHVRGAERDIKKPRLRGSPRSLGGVKRWRPGPEALGSVVTPGGACPERRCGPAPLPGGGPGRGS